MTDDLTPQTPEQKHQRALTLAREYRLLGDKRLYSDAAPVARRIDALVGELQGLVLRWPDGVCNAAKLDRGDRRRRAKGPAGEQLELGRKR